MTPADLHQFILQHKLAVLSTVSAGKSSQSALIGIAVTPDLEIIFDTLNSSRKYANLISNPSCSCVIGWTGEQTVQYEGIAQELAGPELARCQTTYFAAWPECRAHQSWSGIVYFVIKPKWVRLATSIRIRR